jgi:hypothetical protein
MLLILSGLPSPAGGSFVKVMEGSLARVNSHPDNMAQSPSKITCAQV